MVERRRVDRRSFSYYMRVLNDDTGELVGHLTDISQTGFKLDCLKNIQPNTHYRLRLDLTPDVANKENMIFKAISRWCRVDRFDPTSFNVGFQITEISPVDAGIFQRMFEVYGSKQSSDRSSSDYLWH
jgi:hypothetical protein